MVDMTTTQSLQMFLRALQGQNYSPKTLRAYGDDLHQFLAWVQNNRVDWDTPTRMSRADIEGFMQYLSAQRMSGVTRVRKLAAIRKLFAFMAENKILAGNPANTVKGARREEKEPNILYKEQYKALLYEASDNIRDYAIIQTFLQTGIRLSELVNLRVDDVDFAHRMLTVRQGKGKKDRQIPLVDEAVKALRNYLRYRNTEWIEDDEIFFLAKNGTSLNVSTVKYIVAKYVKKAGIRKKVSVHTLRHTFGAHKADKHMSLATLQELMGHKKKETTLKYIHLAKTNLRQEMVETAL
ncbi:MAG TPA: tyrosine-type recombinase/integrase [Gammaproteobacteria bacterium]|nr:tyrosine-type recombinase/integrase [Gammaproteobacteria bacterium]